MVALKPANLKDVFNSVYPARCRYYNIGLNLGIDIGTLEAIKHDERDQSDPCLSTLLKYWLHNITNPLPSWKALSDALRAPNVGIDVIIG